MNPDQTSANSGKRVLIVEDEQFLRDLYLELLKGEDYSVDEAVDGDEALVKMQQGGYDLVLLDMMLPKKNALEVLEILKAQPPKMANKKVVFLTNMAQDTLMEKGKVYGVMDFLIKSSITPEELLQKVSQYLA